MECQSQIDDDEWLWHSEDIRTHTISFSVQKHSVDVVIEFFSFIGYCTMFMCSFFFLTGNCDLTMSYTNTCICGYKYLICMIWHRYVQQYQSYSILVTHTHTHTEYIIFVHILWSDRNNISGQQNCVRLKCDCEWLTLTDMNYAGGVRWIRAAAIHIEYWCSITPSIGLYSVLFFFCWPHLPPANTCDNKKIHTINMSMYIYLCNTLPLYSHFHFNAVNLIPDIVAREREWWRGSDSKKKCTDTFWWNGHNSTRRAMPFSIDSI